MAKTFIFVCPFCNQRLDCDESLENQVVPCPSCNGEIVPTRSPFDGKIRIAPTPSAPKVRKKTPQPKEKKDLLLVWIVYPIFYFFFLVLLAGSKNFPWWGSLVLFGFGYFLITMSEVAIMAETGSADRKKATLMSLLMYVFPIALIMYSSDRKQNGLSNITPWAVLTSIINELMLIIAVWFVFNR